MTDRVRINESAADEWFAVMRHVRPWLSRAEFDELWVKVQDDRPARVVPNRQSHNLSRPQGSKL